MVQHISLPTVTFESGLIFIGIAIGGPIMGWAYPKIQNRNEFLLITALITALISCWMIYDTPISVTITAILFVVLGIICSSYVFNYSLANQVVPKSVRSTSIGFTNTLCVVTAPLLQPLVGWLLHMFSVHNEFHKHYVYTINNYHWALTVIPISLIVASIIALYLPKPTQAVSLKKVNK